jgi:DNA-binding NarL/FixJ family response regulator
MQILVIDDHALIREALRTVLKELDEGVTIREAASWREATVHLEKAPVPDLVLLDLGLPDSDGFAVLSELREKFPAISIVVLSAFNDHDNVAKALDLGALGFIPKSASRAIMLGALRLVFAGGIYIPPDILNPGEPASSVLPGAKAKPQPRVLPRDLGLTERQVEVLALMMLGKSNKAICRTLDLAEPTVKNHVTAILKALKVTNRTEAVIAVGNLGWQLPAVGG